MVMDKILSVILFISFSSTVLAQTYQVLSLGCAGVAADAIYFTWARPADPSRVVQGYKLNLERTDGLVTDVVPTLDINDYYTENFTFSNLGSYAVYTLSINTYTTSGDEPVQQVTCRSNEGVPYQAPSTVEAVGISYTEIKVDWTEIAEKDRGGVLAGYKIVYYKYISAYKTYITVSNTTTTYTIQSLDFDTHYLVGVIAYTSVGDGPVTTDTNKTLGLATNAPEVVRKYYCYEAIPGLLVFSWDEMPCTVYIGVMGFLLMLNFILLVCCCMKKPKADDDDLRRERRDRRPPPEYESDDDHKGPWKTKGGVTARDIVIRSLSPNEQPPDYNTVVMPPKKKLPVVGKNILAENQAKDKEHYIDDGYDSDVPQPQKKTKARIQPVKSGKEGHVNTWMAAETSLEDPSVMSKFGLRSSGKPKYKDTATESEITENPEISNNGNEPQSKKDPKIDKNDKSSKENPVADKEEKREKNDAIPKEKEEDDSSTDNEINENKDEVTKQRPVFTIGSKRKTNIGKKSPPKVPTLNLTNSDVSEEDSDAEDDDEDLPKVGSQSAKERGQPHIRPERTSHSAIDHGNKFRISMSSPDFKEHSQPVGRSEKSKPLKIFKNKNNKIDVQPTLKTPRMGLGHKSMPNIYEEYGDHIDDIHHHHHHKHETVVIFEREPLHYSARSPNGRENISAYNPNKDKDVDNEQLNRSRIFQTSNNTKNDKSSGQGNTGQRAGSSLPNSSGNTHDTYHRSHSVPVGLGNQNQAEDLDSTTSSGKRKLSYPQDYDPIGRKPTMVKPLYHDSPRKRHESDPKQNSTKVFKENTRFYINPNDSLNDNDRYLPRNDGDQLPSSYYGIPLEDASHDAPFWDDPNRKEPTNQDSVPKYRVKSNIEAPVLPTLHTNRDLDYPSRMSETSHSRPNTDYNFPEDIDGNSSKGIPKVVNFSNSSLNESTNDSKEQKPDEINSKTVKKRPPSDYSAPPGMAVESGRERHNTPSSNNEVDSPLSDNESLVLEKQHKPAKRELNQPLSDMEKPKETNKYPKGILKKPSDPKFDVNPKNNASTPEKEAHSTNSDHVPGGSGKPTNSAKPEDEPKASGNSAGDEDPDIKVVMKLSQYQKVLDFITKLKKGVNKK